ncbi:hypothetical protein [Ahrensia sp. R2A130]|uniref:hypothetical protein n=1 Tax=Ahrensia sp. R2A130 TaxID=744979 RepID=UPI0001E0BCC1|nr:hypothetical protein [Ahrensia sp. R2A130]EFL88329.1 hypothetical protein R2A130_3496 [Ahrensia sp. R2A130]
MTEWKSIETAPTDGTIIEVTNGAMGDEDYRIVSWGDYQAEIMPGEVSSGNGWNIVSDPEGDMLRGVLAIAGMPFSAPSGLPVYATKWRPHQNQKSQRLEAEQS